MVQTCRHQQGRFRAKGDIMRQEIRGGPYSIDQLVPGWATAAALAGRRLGGMALFS